MGGPALERLAVRRRRDADHVLHLDKEVPTASGIGSAKPNGAPPGCVLVESLTRTTSRQPPKQSAASGRPQAVRPRADAAPDGRRLPGVRANQRDRTRAGAGTGNAGRASAPRLDLNQQQNSR
jgi:hypothetical protein